MIHLVAALALAGANPADGLECVYRTAERPALVTAGRSLQRSSPDDEAAFKALKAAAGACAKRLGWSEQKGLDSALYAMARQGYEEVVAALAAAGVRTPVVERVAASLTPEQKAQLLEGKHEPLGGQGIAILLASEIGKMPPARQSEAARLVGSGVVALLTRDDIAARFR